MVRAIIRVVADICQPQQTFAAATKINTEQPDCSVPNSPPAGLGPGSVRAQSEVPDEVPSEVPSDDPPDGSAEVLSEVPAEVPSGGPAESVVIAAEMRPAAARSRRSACTRARITTTKIKSTPAEGNSAFRNSIIAAQVSRSGTRASHGRLRADGSGYVSYFENAP